MLSFGFLRTPTESLKSRLLEEELLYGLELYEATTHAHKQFHFLH